MKLKMMEWIRGYMDGDIYSTQKFELYLNNKDQLKIFLHRRVSKSNLYFNTEILA